MNNLNKFGLSAALLCLASCTQTEFDSELTIPTDSHSKILLAGEIEQVNTTRVNDEGFCNGDQIGVYIVDYLDTDVADNLEAEGNRADNAAFTYDEANNRWLSMSDLYYKDDHTHIDIYGYYPYGAPQSVEAYDFEVKRDQSQGASEGVMGGYEASDFLWGKVENAAPSSNVVRVSFYHMMSSVKVTLVEGKGFESGEWSAVRKEVLVNSTARKASINLATGDVVTNGSADATGIVPYANSNEYRAVVVPQSVAAGSSLLSITIDGVPYNYTRPDDVEYLPSKQSSYVLTIGKKENGEYELELTSESITAWESDGISHDATAKEYVVIDVAEAGTLAECIAAAGKNYATLKNLKLLGKINKLDFDFMKNDMSALQSLNLKEVEIVECRFDEYPYTSPADEIPNSAMYGKSTLLRLTLPDKLTKIGDDAFEACGSLTGSIIIPEGVVVIGTRAFNGCSALMGTLELPSSLEVIEGYAFYRCKFISNLNLPTGLKKIENDAFYECSGLYGNLQLPGGLSIIEQNAFKGCVGLTGSLVIPEGVKSIGYSAFANCSGLNGTLTLPKSLEVIETGMGFGTFHSCNFRGELVLPKNLISIGANAFVGNNFSGKLVLPENLAVIGERAFEGCKRISGVLNIPESVASIGAAAFANCSSLEGVVFNKSTEAIASNCFKDCFGIGSIVCQNKFPPVVAPGAFDGVAKDNFTLEVPESSINAYQTTVGWADFKRISAYRNLVIRPMNSSAINTAVSRDLVLNADDAWEVESCPDWITLDKTSGTGKAEIKMSVAEMAQGSEDRVGEVVFKLVGKDYRTRHTVSQYDYEHAEDELITLQSHSKGDGVDIVILGSGFDGKDISEGKYTEAMNDAMEYYFGLPPYSTYRDYFNVYTNIALSSESGVGSANTIIYNKFDVTNKGGGTLGGDDDAIFDYVEENTPITNLDETIIIMIPNTNEYGGICYMWDEGAAIAYCPMSTDDYPYDFRGLVQHEAGGHGFGKLGDEYIYHNAFYDSCDCKCCNHNGVQKAHAKGWFQNLSLSGKMNEVPWSEFIFHPKYSLMVDIFEGGYMHTRGVFRSEQNSCMNNNVPYYSTVSRREMVKRIMKLAGEEYSFDEFVLNDNLNAGSVESRAAVLSTPIANQGAQKEPVFMGRRKK